jgi:hypothetical protein
MIDLREMINCDLCQRCKNEYSAAFVMKNKEMTTEVPLGVVLIECKGKSKNSSSAY